MKIYPKAYRYVYHPDRVRKSLQRSGSVWGSLEELAKYFRLVYDGSNQFWFDIAVKHVWLEQHFTYNGVRRTQRSGNGFEQDKAFGYFMRSVVGYNQKPITCNLMFMGLITYLKDFFPDFLNRNPFTEPEYFKFPYNNITIDHLIFVYQVHNRLEYLEEAETQSMSYHDFVNFATNNAFCYNDEVGKNIYVLYSNMAWPFLKNTTLKRGWSPDRFKFVISPTVNNNEYGKNKT